MLLQLLVHLLQVPDGMVAQHLAFDHAPRFLSTNDSSTNSS